MHGAGFQGRAKIAKMLIDHGLDPLDMHEDGYIGMHRSCWGGAERHAETVQVFLDAGVPYDIESKQLKTCMDTTKNSQTLEVLKKAAASLKDGEGEADAEL
jgi:ankyrin repeat protein